MKCFQSFSREMKGSFEVSQDKFDATRANEKDNGY